MMLVIGKIDRRRNLLPARDTVKLIKIMEGKTSATCSVRDRCMKLTQIVTRKKKKTLWS
jgi:hypothetical protein